VDLQDHVAPSEALRCCLARCDAIRLLIDARHAGTLVQRDAVEAEVGRLVRTLDFVGDLLHGVSTVERDLHQAQRECVACLRLLAYPLAADRALLAVEVTVARVMARVGE
jgi:hypothetical protein